MLEEARQVSCCLDWLLTVGETAERREEREGDSGGVEGLSGLSAQLNWKIK